MEETKTAMEEEQVLTLTQAIQYFEDSEQISHDSRELAEKCRDYVDHKQWTDQEASVLRKRKQPVITRNRIKPKVDFLKGLEMQTRTDPKAYPRTPGDDEASQAATDAIRFVCDQSKFPKVRSGVFDNLAVEGTGGAEVYAKPSKSGDGIEICIRRFQWDRLFYDPHSRELDFSDAMYWGAIAWLDYDQAKQRYPGKEEALAATLASESQLSETFDDTPRIRWSDSKRKRVRVVLMEFKHGEEWYRCEYTKGGWLKDPEPSPYVDEYGTPEPSIIIQSSHVDRDGNRYGTVRTWLDLQDEINKRASKYLHTVSVRQTYSNSMAGGDSKKLKQELAKPDGHLEFNAGEFGKDFGVLPTMDMAEAQFRLLQEAKAEIDSVGVNAALAGAEQRDLSGKAIGRLQQGASTEIKPLYESLAQFNLRVYRAAWNRIRQFWTAEKWIRITDDESNLQWVGLNQPVTIADQLSEEEMAMVMQSGMQDDPRLMMQVGVKNNVAEMDVDIILEEVPDTVNVQQEQFDALTKIFPAIPDMQKPAALEMLVESSTIRNKREFLEKLKGGADPQQKAMMEQQAQQAQQIQQASAEAEIAKDQASAQKDMADAQKTMMETYSPPIPGQPI